MTQFGFRAVVSTSFADIFKQNSLQNSLLPIVVPPDAHAELFVAAAENPDSAVKIDLANQTLTTPGGRKGEFPVALAILSPVGVSGPKEHRQDRRRHSPRGSRRCYGNHR